jgi:hypothetical protein
MPDSSAMTALISSGGTLAGALVGALANHWSALRREQERAASERQVRAEEKRSRSADDARRACMELLGYTEQLRDELGSAAQRHWPDMSEKMKSIMVCAAALGQRTAQVAVLCPGAVSLAARDLTAAARALQETFVKQVALAPGVGVDPQVLGGQLAGRLSFDDYDAKRDAFYLALVTDGLVSAPEADISPSES